MQPWGGEPCPCSSGGEALSLQPLVGFPIPEALGGGTLCLYTAAVRLWAPGRNGGAGVKGQDPHGETSPRSLHSSPTLLHTAASASLLCAPVH